MQNIQNGAAGKYENLGFQRLNKISINTMNIPMAQLWGVFI